MKRASSHAQERKVSWIVEDKGMFLLRNVSSDGNSTNVLVRLLTANMNNSLTPKIQKCAAPF